MQFDLPIGSTVTVELAVGRVDVTEIAGSVAYRSIRSNEKSRTCEAAVTVPGGPSGLR